MSSAEIPLDPLALELCALSKTFKLGGGMLHKSRTLKAVNNVSLRVPAVR